MPVSRPARSIESHHPNLSDWPANVSLCCVCVCVFSFAGDYVCQIGDEQPKDQVHTLEILVPPAVRAVPDHGIVSARQGGTATLECKASGNPTPRVYWYRKVSVLCTLNGSLLNPMNAKKSFKTPHSPSYRSVVLPREIRVTERVQFSRVSQLNPLAL
jgi:hypothetical protein